MGNPLALKQELATWIMPMKPILKGIQRKKRVAVSTTIGLLSIRLTKYAPNWIMTMKVKTPQAKQNVLHRKSVLLTRSIKRAPQFWPMRGSADEEQDHKII